MQLRQRTPSPLLPSPSIDGDVPAVRIDAMRWLRTGLGALAIRPRAELKAAIAGACCVGGGVLLSLSEPLSLSSSARAQDLGKR